MHAEQGKNSNLIVKGQCFPYSHGSESGNTVGFPAWDSSYFSDVQDVGPLFWAQISQLTRRGASWEQQRTSRQAHCPLSVFPVYAGSNMTQWVTAWAPGRHWSSSFAMHQVAHLEQAPIFLCSLCTASTGIASNYYQSWLFMGKRGRAYQGPASQKDLIVHHHRVQKVAVQCEDAVKCCLLLISLLKQSLEKYSVPQVQ